MKAIIIANGEIKDFKIVEKYIKEKDIIICCDGGAKYIFDKKIIPNYIIGDLDSILPQVIDFFKLNLVNIKEYPKDKDKTDMELCIDFVSELKLSEVVIFGGIGSRIDHTLSNINLLLKAKLLNISAKLINEKNEIILICNNEEILIEGSIGNLISLIPAFGDAYIEYSEGLKYNLNNMKFSLGNSIGISNELAKNFAKIKVKKGYLFLIRSKD